MDKKVLEDKEKSFNELLAAQSLDLGALQAIIKEVPSGKADDFAAELLKRLVGDCNFSGVFTVLKDRLADFEKKLGADRIRIALRDSTKDRLIASFVDSCEFGARPLADSMMRLERLVSLAPGRLVLSPAWGLGEVKRLDYFYRKITIDFKGRRGQQMTFPTACETLSLAPEDHILVKQRADPDGLKKKFAEKPGDFVKDMIASFGPLTQIRLEELMVQHGFIKPADYKKFWEAARVDLKKDPCVELPVRKTDAIVVKKSAEDYGAAWFTAFRAMTDPKEILSAVRLLVAQKKMPKADGTDEDRIHLSDVEDRMSFAVKGARCVDDALYAQLACTATQLGLAKPSGETMRAYLWDHERYLESARLMPARETGDLVKFLSCELTDAAARDRFFAAFPQMCFQLLTSVIDAYFDDPACHEAVARLLINPKAPATLVTCVLGRYGKFADWAELPSLSIILGHAIALGEGRQNGETLRMQNIVRRLFADQAWLKSMLDRLSTIDRESFFERFQASIAWDPSTHHAITTRMTKLAPELAAHLIKAKKTVEVLARLTSYRSYAERKAQYLDVINVQIPKNAKDIEFARGYGDLSENAEYQYAKDKQRELMQTQTLMQKDLEDVKPTDFADVVPDAVKPGVTVVLAFAGGVEKTYTILGEWDNVQEKNIIADKTRLAQCIMGCKVGDKAKVPGGDGVDVEAEIADVRALSDEVREWVKLPAGMSI